MIRVPPCKGKRELEERTGKNAEDFLDKADIPDEEDEEEEE